MDSLAARLKRLTEAVDAFEQSGFTTPPRVDGADANGDEVARLAAQVQTMSGRIASQIGALERVARQRRELLANVSHDLRTPLASMQGYLELLLMRPAGMAPSEERMHLETAARQSERLSRLVGDLFHLTELEADDMRPACEDFTLAELAHDLVQKYAADASRRGIDLTVDADPAVRASADIGLVERVLINLVENALRHTPGGGAVGIEVAREDSGGGGRARVTVRDSGEGIAAADLAGLFDRFERTERVAGGGAMAHGGLGLPIARRIVELHGGAITVQSQPSRGTRVSFDLALAGSAARAEATPVRRDGIDPLRHKQNVLDAVSDGTRGTFGTDFFAALVRSFARALEVDCAFITECRDDPPTRLRTLAYWSAAGGMRENFEYLLAGTPCDAVVNEGRLYFHREGVARMFPREKGVESFLGIPITASDGRMLGHLALMHGRPRGDELLVGSVYAIVLARAASEIERLRALELGNKAKPA